MIVPRKKGSYASFLLLAMSLLGLQNVLVSSYEYTFSMPLNSAQVFDERAKRSLATICVEIKPNGPLEEPYYMCKGTDFPPFSKIPGAGNMPNTQYSSTAGNSGTAFIPNTKNYNEATYNNRDNGASGANFQGYSSTTSGNQNAHSLTETHAPLNQQYSHTNSKQKISSKSGASDVSNSQLQIKFNAGVSSKVFQQQASSGSNYQKPSEQYQHHFPADFQQQFPQQQQILQHYQQQQNQHQLPQTQQLLPAHYHKPKQFFRPPSKTEFNTFPEKLDGYDSIYSDDGIEGRPKQQAGYIPTSYGSQHPTSFGTRPTDQNSGASSGSDGSPFPSHASNNYEAPHSSTSVANCGENCGKSINQVTPASGPAHDGITQFAAKPTIHSKGYDGKNAAQSYTSNGVNAQQRSSVISNGDDKSSSPAQSVNYPPAPIARTPYPPSLRYAGNGAVALLASDWSTLPNIGANDTPLLESAYLRPPVGSTHDGVPIYPKEATYPEPLLGGNGLQSPRRPQLEIQSNNQQFLRNNQRNSHYTSPKAAPAAQRYRSMIDDDVLQMPNWGFSSDELDLYRRMPDEVIDNNLELTARTLAAPPRMIPIEHLEDPVMRAFYSSLDDVGPLPTVSPIYQAPILAQPPRHTKPPTPQRMPYPMPIHGCSYSSAPQYPNCNPCSTQRELNYQPVFIALPCYGQSMYQSMINQATAAVPGNYDQLSMVNQFSDPLTRFLSIGNPVTHLLTSSNVQTMPQTQPPPQPPQPQSLPTSVEERAKSNTNSSPSNNGANTKHVVSSQKELQLKPSTTAPTTLRVDSNESGESIEESSTAVSRIIQTNKSGEEDSPSAELKLTSSEKPKTTVTTSRPMAEKLGNPLLASTPSSVDSLDSQMDSEMSTTFKSLILTAKKLAQMVTTSQEEEEMMYKDDISTPKPAPKRVRQALRSSQSNGNKRRFLQQMQQQ